MQRKTDIFDRIMRMPFLKKLEPFYKKNKEMLLYLFFGAGSFLISVLTYALMSELFQFKTTPSNAAAWGLSVTFAYITNRIWVFEKSAAEAKGIIKEIGKFVSGRIFSLIVENGLLYLLIDLLQLPNMPIKIAVSILIILLNYVISKLWVFKHIKKCAAEKESKQ